MNEFQINNPADCMAYLLIFVSFLARTSYFSTLLNLMYLVFKIKQPQLLATFVARELSRTRNQRWVFGNVDRACSFFFTELSDLEGIFDSNYV